MKTKETAQIFFSRLDYNRASGEFYWKTMDGEDFQAKRFNTVFAGKIAGYDDGRGYRRISLNFGEIVIRARIHQVVWLFETGNWPKKHIDHIDQNKLNNVFSNLREVDNKTNCQNKSKSKNNTSGVQGVQFNRKFYKGEPKDYWVARWPDSDGVQKVKHFRISVHGYEEAFQLACEYRKRMLDLLNQNGGSYTERHGT